MRSHPNAHLALSRSGSQRLEFSLTLPSPRLSLLRTFPVHLHPKVDMILPATELSEGATSLLFKLASKQTQEGFMCNLHS
eukprot:Skav234941  [mRNA]  locus=scaffold2677:258315:260515:+ [translate_table: standard]